ncbi:MAG TPA: NUDIX domain-containing protein [Tardiphaga sp.]
MDRPDLGIALNDQTSRASARVFLFAPDNQVLLIRFVVQRLSGEFAFWATPGGRVEKGETPLATAHRELFEELEIRTTLKGPVHSATDQFEHEGSMIRNTDLFFLGRCDHASPRLRGVTDLERSAMRSIRWWTVDEIADAEETVFPNDLAEVLRKIV